MSCSKFIYDFWGLLEGSNSLNFRGTFQFTSRRLWKVNNHLNQLHMRLFKCHTTLNKLKLVALRTDVIASVITNLINSRRFLIINTFNFQKILVTPPDNHMRHIHSKTQKYNPKLFSSCSFNLEMKKFFFCAMTFN